ncbi:MAG: aminotransferase class III-fold pyridoxal phosphate-dependent enzyme [Acidobacteriota bacterium]
MGNNTTRREALKGLVGLTVGSGLAGLALPAEASTGTLAPAIDVGIQPPGPKSLRLLERLKGEVGRSNYAGLYGIALQSGDGCYIRDVDGNVYLDCLTAASCNILGYSHDEVARAYYDTAVRIQQTCFAYSPNEETVAFAERLAAISPGEYRKKALIGLTGSDSIGGAIEAARKYTGKMGIISFNFAYHGSTGLSQAASGFTSLNEGVYDANDPNFVKVDFPTTPEEGERTLKNIETILAFGKVGAVLVEIIQGDAGKLQAPAGFFGRLKDLLAGYGVLLIADEVQSGMGRTGRWWASDHEEIAPDLVVMGKGLSAGYAPVSALVGRAEVIDALVPAGHVFTYMGHGPSVAAASAVIDIIQAENLVENARVVGAHLLRGLKAAERFSDVVVEARGRGLMLGVEINVEKDALASKVFAFRCLEKGIYFGYIGDKQRVIRVLPPLVLSREEADIIIRVVHEVAEEMAYGKVPQATIDRVQTYTLGW